MTRTIVVPLDRSPVAERALPFATALARQTGSRLTLLSVIDMPFEFAAWLDTTTAAEEKINVEDAFEDYLDVLATRIDDIPVETVVRIGGAATEIEHYVETLDDAIVVMASHGRSGVSRMLIGSVTEQVVHRVKKPVIVVPARRHAGDEPPVTGIHSVLFPLDGSEFSEYALEAGLELLGPAKPEIHLMRVVEVVSWYGDPYAGMDMQGLDMYLDSSREAATDYLYAIAERLEGRGYIVTTEVRVGLVADQVDALADSWDADLVIMATHGRSGVGRLLFGSVAERALRQLTKPLMLVRPRAVAIEDAETLADTMLVLQA